ncbi:MAG: ribonuclease J [Candidatus Spechtbacterales bacterium]
MDRRSSRTRRPLGDTQPVRSQVHHTTGEPTLRIIPLGGLGETGGRNMTLFEYNDKILVIDMGLQFPEGDMPGIDYIIPNASYITDNPHKEVVGVAITHGHLDHFGAVAHLIDKIGKPPIFCGQLTKALILKRQTDHPQSSLPDITAVKRREVIKLPPFEIEFFHINHSIPDSFGIVLRTPDGNTIVHTGDFKFDPDPVGDTPADFEHIEQIGKRGVTLLMSDSTNAEAPGLSIPETVVQKNLGDLISKAPGRVIAGTFGSLLSRVQEFIYIAEEQGRYIAFDGYTMKTNVEIAKEFGYLKVQRGTIIPIKDVNDYPDNKVLVVCTGAQGEGEAVLMRIATGEHRSVQIHKNDSVIFSSSSIPGNERDIQGLKDSLSRRGAEIYDSRYMDIHTSGHARAEDLKKMIELTKPKYLFPIQAQHFMRRAHAKLGYAMGIPEENVILGDNGEVCTLDKNHTFHTTKERVNVGYVLVDGLGVGDVGQVVLRDRQALASDGMMVVIAVVDGQTGKVVGNPDIISRGFIYLRESKAMLGDVRKRSKAIIENATGQQDATNWEYVKENMRDQLGKLLFDKTQRRPMVLPVVIEV